MAAVSAAEIAEALKTSLNTAEAVDGTFSQAFTAVRRYAISTKLEDLGDDINVALVPVADARAPFARDKQEREVSVQIVVQKRIASTSNPNEATGNTELDTLSELVTEIANWLKPGIDMGATGAQWVRTVNEPIYSADHLQNHNQFLSVITATFKAYVTRTT